MAGDPVLTAMELDPTFATSLAANAVNLSSKPPSVAANGARSFSGAAAWRDIGEGWRPLSGNFRAHGFSVEWHDFTTDQDFDWAPSFHPGAVEICLNIAGRGEVNAGRHQLALGPLTAGFYFQGRRELKGRRLAGERHRFLTIELSVDFLARHLEAKDEGLHPALRELLAGKAGSEVSGPVRLTDGHRQLALDLSHPPVSAAAQRLWYHGKALEIASSLLYQPEATGEFFCQRHKRQNRDRVDRVIALLKENLAAPPSLEEIGRRVGCSHFYLSRIFSQEMGRGVFQYLRVLRMERAAELLREARLNVTQVAMEVGYSSPSHFSTAFHETYGCCPGLYPLRTLPSVMNHRAE
jgi:AraC-like DNA-binding protein